MDLIQNYSVTHRDTTETTESGPLCITDFFQNKSVAYFQFLVIFFYRFSYIFLNFILCNFSVRTLGCFTKHLNILFYLKKLKKTPKKVAYLWQSSWEYFLCSPDFPKQPRTSFLFYKFFYLIISGRISGDTDNSGNLHENTSNCTFLLCMYES